MLKSHFDPAEVQYMGIPGDTETCVLAVDTVVNSENPPRKASVVGWRKDLHSMIYEHLFLFWDWNKVPLTVVHSGFTSGYGGTGPHGFSEALCMVFCREIPTNPIFVNETDFNAIENRRLTAKIIDRLHNADDRPIEWPWGWIMPRDLEQLEKHTFWSSRHHPKMVFDFLSPDIAKRCQKLHAHDPEAAVFMAFKVVEERLRSLVSNSKGDEEALTADRLIAAALNPTSGILTDKTLSLSEREGKFLMFKGAFQFVRNPRAHRIVDNQDEQHSIELMYFADLLLRILPDGPSAGTPASETSQTP